MTRKREEKHLAQHFTAVAKGFVHLFANCRGTHHGRYLLVHIDIYNHVGLVGIVIHGTVGFVCWVGFFLVEVVAQPRNSVTGEHTKHIALVLIEFCGNSQQGQQYMSV